MHFSRIDFDGRKRAHCINDQAFTVTFADVTYSLQGVEHAGTSFAVDETYMRHGWVGSQFRVQFLGRNGLIFRALKDGRATTHQCGQFTHALAVGTIVQDQHMAITRHQCGDSRLH